MAAYQKLFEHLANEFNLNLVQSELQEIIKIVKDTEILYPTDDDINKRFPFQWGMDINSNFQAQRNAAKWCRDLIKEQQITN